jgi:hypothetical protein
MSKHTPGPWRIERGGKEHRKPDLHKRILAADGTDLLGNVEDPWYPNVPENEADWHLIAAAPDLLEACKAALTESMIYTGAIYETLQTSGLHTQLRDQLRAAIAKASGGSQPSAEAK